MVQVFFHWQYPGNAIGSILFMDEKRKCTANSAQGKLREALGLNHLRSIRPIR